jgi:membrane-associated protease RseP (regulator of RpoE activity)
MRTLALPAALAAAVLALIAVALVLSGSPPAAVDVEMPAPRLAELRAQLDEERRAREVLAARVRSLDARLAALGAEPPTAPPQAWRGPDAAPDASVATAEVAAEPEPAPRAGARGSFDAEALRSSGLSGREVAWLRERWERSQLDALYLTDQALREGWGMGQLRSARLQQRREFQDEIGTAMYDLMLYATGRENRVVVRDVYVGSAAEASDLRPGDVIVAYAGTPVFDDRDLRLLSSSGEAGLPITIQVVRGGTLENLQIERGPLGVSTRRERVPPPRP